MGEKIAAFLTIVVFLGLCGYVHAHRYTPEKVEKIIQSEEFRKAEFARLGVNL